MCMCVVLMLWYCGVVLVVGVCLRYCMCCWKFVDVNP
jgi:hypothetical protein